MVSNSSNGNGRPSDGDGEPPEIFYQDLPGDPRLPLSVSQASIKETFHDRRRDQEFFIRIHISPKAAAILLVLLTLVTRLVEGLVWYFLNGRP